MNVAALLNKYFGDRNASQVSIDVFDKDSIDAVYSRVIKVLRSYLSIELGVLQALSYCFYEVLDNVLIHSDKHLGTVITTNDEENHILRVLVADDGVGVHKSLTVNHLYKSLSESDELW